MPETYMSVKQIAERYGKARTSVLQRLNRADYPPPDVICGVTPAAGKHIRGWSSDRVTAYGIFVGLLDEHGERRIDAQWWVPPLVRTDWWTVDTRLYLSVPDLAWLWGIKPASVYALIQRDRKGQRDRMLEPDVLIGHTRTGDYIAAKPSHSGTNAPKDVARWSTETGQYFVGWQEESVRRWSAQRGRPFPDEVPYLNPSELTTIST